jgi:hypothetical protein
MPKKCDQLEVIEEEMPTICCEKTIYPASGWSVYTPKVPAGYKLVVKKAGMEKAKKDSHLEIGISGANPDVVIEGDVVYTELDLEYHEGEYPVFCMVNRGTTQDTYMVWFVFDFIPV